MKERAYLVIHGFGGSTAEIEYLVCYLKGRGLDAHTVLIAGHGGTKKELSRYSYVDWIHSVKSAIAKLRRNYKQITLLGFSMGGLLSVHFASMPQIHRLVFINTPIYFWNIRIILTDILSAVQTRQFEKLSYYSRSATNISIKSGIDFLALLMKSVKKIADIQKPVMIVQCTRDESVHVKSAAYIKARVGGKAVLRYYQGGCHQVFTKAVDLRDAVCRDIFRFLARSE